MSIVSLEARWAWRSSFSGDQRSSASRRAIQSPDAIRIPVFFAAEGPLLVRVMTRTPNPAATAFVSSVEPSSTTITSTGCKVCARTDAILRGRKAAALYAGMTTLIFMLVLAWSTIPSMGRAASHECVALHWTIGWVILLLLIKSMGPSGQSYERLMNTRGVLGAMLDGSQAGSRAEKCLVGPLKGHSNPQTIL